jgi:hypothetical protein
MFIMLHLCFRALEYGTRWVNGMTRGAADLESGSNVPFYFRGGGLERARHRDARAGRPVAKD